jgi:ribonuclease J
MWNGYVDPSRPAYNEKLAKSLGESFLYKHTSGHYDMNSLRDVLLLLKPKAIIPLHTENPEAFAQLFKDEWQVIVLNDGDSFQPYRSKNFVL